MITSPRSGFNAALANYPRPAIALTAVSYLLLGYLETLPGRFVPPLLYFGALGVLALVIMPFVLGLPNGRKPLGEFCRDIRLLPARPVARNIVLGLALATLTLSAILLSALLTGHFEWDWTLVPATRWVKGLTRGIWEEVFFRGIILVLAMRAFPGRRGIIFSAFLFAIVHFNPMRLSVLHVVDVISIFFMGLLFIHVVLKTGSLLPAIVFHYVHNIFVLLVQNAPGADATLASVLLFALLWAALAVGAILTSQLVKHWPASGRSGAFVGPQEAQDSQKEIPPAAHLSP